MYDFIGTVFYGYNDQCNALNRNIGHGSMCTIPASESDAERVQREIAILMSKFAERRLARPKLTVAIKPCGSSQESRPRKGEAVTAGETASNQPNTGYMA
jgi:hypothetical protein